MARPAARIPAPAGQASRRCGRWHADGRRLTAEIAEHDPASAASAASAADVSPALLAQSGIYPPGAAALLIAAGGSRHRVHRESSFAALCGVSPLPAASGRTNRHRLSRGGNGPANSALHTAALTRMRSGPACGEHVAMRTAQGLVLYYAIQRTRRTFAKEH